MNPSEYARMHALEDWYWWFVARRAAAASFLRAYAPRASRPDAPLKVLDAGCGTGAMLDLLRRWENVQSTGADFARAALGFSSGRGHRRLVAADLEALPFADNSFDVVTALDVIEHVPDDRAALCEVARVLRPGGILVATVPAYQFLWGPHDVALHHKRRYLGSEFRRRVEGAGLAIVKQTYLVSALFPLAAAVRLARRHRAPGESEDAMLPRVPAFVNRALIRFQAMELAIAKRVSLPFGLTVLAVARKAGDLRDVV